MPEPVLQLPEPYTLQDGYETVANMGVNALAANMLIENYTPGGDVDAVVYAKGIGEAYMAGTLNIPQTELATMPFAADLAGYQRQAAYQLGELFGGRQTAKAQATIRKNRTVDGVDMSKGKVHFEGDRTKLNETQRASLDAMDMLAKSLGVQIYVFESEVGADGKRRGANGWYDPSDGSIHIDLYAGADGKGTMLFTVAHELTHFIRQWSPAKFKVLANFLMKQYGEQGVSVRELVQNQIDKAKRGGRELTYEEAYEEVVADSMETMLTDGNVVQMMAELRQQDKGLWQKIRDWFKDLAGKLKAVVDAYKGVKPDSAEGRLVADMQDVIVILESLYADALVDASENYNAGAQKNTAQGGSLKNIKESGRRKQSPRTFTYKELSAKNDLQGRTIEAKRNVKVKSDGSIDREWVVSEVLKQCDSIQTKAPHPTYFVNVPDIGKNVEITGTGIKHGFIKFEAKNGKPVPARSMLNARASLDLPQILQNSVEVNRSDRGDNAEVDFSHVLIGVTAMEDSNGNVDYYAVRSVVEARKNQGAILTEANVIGKLHAMNAKKIGTPHAQVGGNTALTSSPLFGYSIADLLNDVKDDFNDTFSDDVYKHFGMTRKVSDFSKHLKFSDRDPDYQKVNKVLEQENEKLREDVSYLKELVKLQRQVTGGAKFTKTSVEAAARSLKEYANAKGDTKELAGLLNSLYEYVASGKELTWEDVKERAQPAVEWLQEHVDTKSQTNALEYARNREMIAQDLFHQVYDSYWRVPTLYTVADVKQREINRLKGEHFQRMTKLREYHREKTAQLKQEHKERLEKVRQDYRDRADAKVRKIVEKHQESRQKGIEGRRKTEMRHKIQKVVKKLNDLL